MSDFTRTLSGINNQYLFYDVDYIVYVEGGSESLTKEAVYSGKFNCDTEDIHFWRKVFEEQRPDIKYKFKSVGSKVTLLDIAPDILTGRLDRVYIAMDNEFDEILNKRLHHAHVFYTNGYSYENDIWNPSVVVGLLKDLTAATVNEDFIINGYNKFISDIKFAVVADGYFFNKGMSFFPRQKGHLFCIECSVDAFPDVKQDTIDKLIVEKGFKVSTIKAYGYRKKIDTQKHCFGHLLADYCCQIIIHYLKKFHQKSGMKKDLLYRMAIAKFFDKFYKGSAIEIYYQQQFAI